MTIDSFLGVFLTAVLSSGVMAFFLKKWIEHSFHTRISKMEARQKRDALEHQVRFTRYDEKLTLSIEGAYELVCEYADALKKVVEKSILGTAVHEDQTALDVVADRFSQYMQRQSIYLPPDIAKKLIETRAGLRNLANEELSKSSELESRVANGEQVSRIMALTFRRQQVKEKCEDVMTDLQTLVREHLSRFAATP